MHPQHPDHPHRNDWRLTIALFALTGLVESLAFGHLSAFTPLYLRQLHVAPGDVPRWTGILSSLGFIIGLPMLPFWGVLADRYGRKIIIIRSSVAAALIYALSALAPNVYWLGFARFWGGFVLGNTGVMMAVQADITPRDRLGTAVAIISAGSPVGMAVGPMLGGQIVDTLGVRSLLWLDTGLTLLVVLALVLFLREEPREVDRTQTARAGVAEAIRAIVHTPLVAGLFGVVFFLALGLSMAMPYTPILVAQLYHGLRPGTTIGVVLTLTGITMAVSTPIWGRIGDRRGHLAVLRLCATLVAVTLAGQAAATTVSQVGFWRAAQGLCQGGIGAMSMTLLALYSPRERRSSILTLSLLPQQLAWFLGPLAASGISAFGVRPVFWMGVFALVIGLVLSVRLPAVEAPEVHEAPKPVAIH
jgi:DHA1 family multidrug resistance protein-like MFS transporter